MYILPGIFLLVVDGHYKVHRSTNKKKDYIQIPAYCKEKLPSLRFGFLSNLFLLPFVTTAALEQLTEQQPIAPFCSDFNLYRGIASIRSSFSQRALTCSPDLRDIT